MNIVYCFIGNLPEYAVDTVHQTRLFYYGPIYFIVSDMESPFIPQLQAYNVIIIPYSTVIDIEFAECITQYYSKFEIVPHLKGREKLFVYAFERFAVLYQTMLRYELSTVFFMELDNLIYDDPLKWLSAFCTKDIAYMYDNVERGASGVCFIKHTTIMKKLVDYFIYFIGNSNKNITEMIALHEFWENNKDLVQILPTHWSSSQYDVVADEYDRYHSIFDSAAMGIFLGGLDPFHTDGVIEKGIEWPHSMVTYKSYEFEWRKDSIGRSVPYIKGDSWIRINNLHIHSKDLASNLSVPQPLFQKRSVHLKVQLLFMPELDPLPVMKCVFRELAPGFNYDFREVYSLDHVEDGGIIFLDDASGNYKQKQSVYEQLAIRCPTTVFICWYWTDTSFRPFTYMIHTGEYYLYLESKKSEINAYEYMNQPSFIPLRLRANDDPCQIGKYARTHHRDYCFMGGGYKMDWVPPMFTGLYHRVVYDNYLSYNERKQVYLSSMFALAFQSDENIRTGHLSQRVFEGLAYGCIVLCENPLATAVTNGAVIYIASKEDLVAKMHFYKNNPDLVLEQQRKGYEWIKQYGTNRYSASFFLSYMETHLGITIERPIVTVNIMGGLGNQLFQIASAYAYAKKHNGRLQIVRKRDNGNRPVYWDTFLSGVEPYLVESVPSTLEPWSEWKPTMYSDITPLTSKGKYLNGYLQSAKYFAAYKDEIKQLFTLERTNSSYDYLLQNKDRVIVVHSRQTDYIAASHVHGPLTHDYYRRAFERMNHYVTDPIYVLCGDDMSFWWKEALPIRSAVFLMNETDIDTIQLLRQFHHFIMSNSTFIWWCVWLADAKRVLVPSTWFGPAGPRPYDDIYEPDWERI